MIAGTALGAAALAPQAEARAAAALQTLDPARPADLDLIHRKLAWSMDSTVGFWWLKGMRYGALPPNYTPFWNMLIGTIFQVRDIDAENYAVTTITTTFYTDPATGALLETFKNPITGKENKIQYPSPRPSERKFGRNGEEAMPSMPGMTATRGGGPGPAWIEGDDVWVRSDMSFRAVPVDLTRKAFQVEDLSTYFGSLKDVANPKLKAIPAGQVFTDMLNYPGWLEMGDRNGHYFSRCFGRKVFSQAAMPQDWQKLMAERYPAIARDPAAALKG
jgi:hypothetical protein